MVKLYVFFDVLQSMQSFDGQLVVPNFFFFLLFFFKKKCPWQMTKQSMQHMHLFSPTEWLCSQCRYLNVIIQFSVSMKKIENQLFTGTIVIKETGWWRNQLNKQLL